jgi:VWFA-related protein
VPPSTAGRTARYVLCVDPSRAKYDAAAVLRRRMIRLRSLLSFAFGVTLATFSLSGLSVGQFVARDATALQQAESPYSAPLLDVITRNVILDIVVTDEHGHPVAGLTRNDFKIREDRRLQQPRSFEAVTPKEDESETSPRTILLVDEMNNRFEDMAYTRYCVNKLLANGGELLDQPTALYVLVDKGLIVLKDYTRDPKAIKAALYHHKAVLPLRLDDNPDTAIGRIDLSLTVLQQIAIANFGAPRHTNIVWISAGFPTLTTLSLDAVGLDALFDVIRHLSDQLLQARVSVSSVDPQGVIALNHVDSLVTTKPQFAQYTSVMSHDNQAAFGDIVLKTLAKQTGGQTFYGSNNVDREVATSIADSNTYYTLSYAPANHDFHGEFRRIKVDIAGRPNLQVRTRDGYYAISDGRPVDQARQTHELVSSLYSPLQYSSIPIPISKANVTKTQVTVRFAVPSSSLSWAPDAQGRLHTTVSVAAADQDKRGGWREQVARVYSFGLPAGVAPAADRATQISFEMPYHESHHVRFVVRDDASARVGSSEITLDTPKRLGPKPPG